MAPSQHPNLIPVYKDSVAANPKNIQESDFHVLQFIVSCQKRIGSHDRQKGQIPRLTFHTLSKVVEAYQWLVPKHQAQIDQGQLAK